MDMVIVSLLVGLMYISCKVSVKCSMILEELKKTKAPEKAEELKKTEDQL